MNKSIITLISIVLLSVSVLFAVSDNNSIANPSNSITDNMSTRTSVVISGNISTPYKTTDVSQVEVLVLDKNGEKIISGVHPNSLGAYSNSFTTTADSCYVVYRLLDTSTQKYYYSYKSALCAVTSNMSRGSISLNHITDIHYLVLTTDVNQPGYHDYLEAIFGLTDLVNWNNTLNAYFNLDIASGTYNYDFGDVFLPINAPCHTNINIAGNGNVIIYSPERNRFTYDLRYLSFNFYNITFSSFSNVFDIFAIDSSSIVLNNCNFYNNGEADLDVNPYPHFFSGAVLHMGRNSFDTTPHYSLYATGDNSVSINNCLFQGNIVSHQYCYNGGSYNHADSLGGEYLKSGFGSAIAIDMRQPTNEHGDPSSFNITINNSVFNQNKASNGTIALLGPMNVNITGCKFKQNALFSRRDIDNSGDPYISIAPAVDIISFQNTSMLVKRCVFDSDSTNYIHNEMSVLYADRTPNMKFINNTIANCRNINGINWKSTSTSNNIFKYYNNLFYDNYSDMNGTANNIVPINRLIGAGTVSICNSMTHGYNWPTSYHPYPNGLPVGTIVDCKDTSVDIAFDGVNLVPYWTSSSKSIALIDKGKKDTDDDGTEWYNDSDDCDADATRSDIGAKSAAEHETHSITLTNEVNNTANWICFPALDKLYTGTPDVDHISYVLNEYHDNNLLRDFDPLMQTCNRKYNEPNPYSIYWNINSWQHADYALRSQYGFKLQLTSGTNSVRIDDDGFRCGQTGNLDNTITLNAGSLLAPNEVWVGYFFGYSVSPLISIPSNVLSNLLEIKTKYWSMSRATLNQPWAYSSRTPKFNYGEAVSLKYAGTSNANFTWQPDLTKGDNEPYYEPISKHFIYNEKLDYVPFYINIANNKSIAKSGNGELALFVNGECYGSEVVYGDTIQINGYINDIPNIDQATIEFRYWDGSAKAVEQKIDDYAVYNQNYHVYEARPLELNTRDAFYTLSFNPQDITNGSVPAVTSLETNYPNPFNPETTIKYSVAKAGKVNLSIYNAKGQLVRTLINSTMEPGFRSIVWKGENNNGSKVSSGVYFYRLQTAEKVMTKKMLLMK